MAGTIPIFETPTGALELTCASHLLDTGPQTTQDTLKLFTDKGIEPARIIAVMSGVDADNDRIELEVWLDEERARALFNWLGVWLHGGNRD